MGYRIGQNIIIYMFNIITCICRCVDTCMFMWTVASDVTINGSVSVHGRFTSLVVHFQGYTLQLGSCALSMLAVLVSKLHTGDN